MNVTSLAVSFLALAVSVLTVWFTLLRRGTIRMTQPTTIYFGPDGGPLRPDQRYTKVYLRTLLYSTSKRGQLVESMYVRLQRGESSQNFNIWVYGDRELLRGSGLFVGENGVAANHHFLPPLDGASFAFTSGSYSLEVFATLVGRKPSLQLFATQLQVTPDHAAALREPTNGLYFDWGPDSSAYSSHIRVKTQREPPDFLRELLG
jgi:hypothetical protein